MAVVSQLRTGCYDRSHCADFSRSISHECVWLGLGARYRWQLRDERRQVRYGLRDERRVCTHALMRHAFATARAHAPQWQDPAVPRGTVCPGTPGQPTSIGSWSGPLSARQRGKCSERVSHGGCAGTHAQAPAAQVYVLTVSGSPTGGGMQRKVDRTLLCVRLEQLAAAAQERQVERIPWRYSVLHQLLQRTQSGAGVLRAAMPCHAMPCHAMPERVTSSRHHVRVSAGELTSSSKTSTVDSITCLRTHSGPNKRVWHSPQSTAPRTAQRKQTAERRRLIGASATSVTATVQQPAQDIPMRRRSAAYHLDCAADAVPPLGIPLGRVDVLVERDDVDPKQRLALRSNASRAVRATPGRGRVQTGEQRSAAQRKACGGKGPCSVISG